MTSLLLCAVFALAQAPAQAAQTHTKRDTIYVAVQAPPTVNVQTPPPSVTVESPGDTPTIVLGAIGAILILAQVVLMWRQTNAMNQQTTILDKQTALGEQQAAWRRSEALGTLDQVGWDLVCELSRSVGAKFGKPIGVDPTIHARQVLREAGRVFAPLGDEVVRLMNGISAGLEQYQHALVEYNKTPGASNVKGLFEGAIAWREVIARDFDQAVTAVYGVKRVGHDTFERLLEKVVAMSRSNM